MPLQYQYWNGTFCADSVTCDNGPRAASFTVGYRNPGLLSRREPWQAPLQYYYRPRASAAVEAGRAGRTTGMIRLKST